MANRRGALRKLSDPVAIATQGRQTTYEEDEVNVSGISTKVRIKTMPLKLKVSPVQ